VSDDPDPPLDATEVLTKDIRNHALRQATHAQFSPLIETKDRVGEEAAGLASRFRLDQG
jgi:hypothetical protein